MSLWTWARSSTPRSSSRWHWRSSARNITPTSSSCLPLQFTITNVFYNKDAFEAAGLEVPTVDDRWTMDEVYEAAAKLMADGGVKYGMAVDFSRARYDNLMYMNGGSMVEKDGDSFKVAINSQANIDTLQTFVDKNNEGIMPKAIWAGGSTDNPGDYFKNGDWACTSPVPGTTMHSPRTSPALNGALCLLRSAL